MSTQSSPDNRRLSPDAPPAGEIDGLETASVADFPDRAAARPAGHRFVTAAEQFAHRQRQLQPWQRSARYR